MGNPSQGFTVDTSNTGAFSATHSPGLLWHNPFTGQVLLWHTRSSLPIQATALPSVTNRDVRLVTTGDLDGDGTSEIVWRDRTTGLNFLWDLSVDGLVVAETTEISQEQNLNAYPVGFGDFNGDARDDLVWRYPDLGQSQIWYMNGALATGSNGLESNLNLSDQLVGTGDFDGDGTSELLWRDDQTGVTQLWFMDGLTRDRSVSLPERSDTNWRIEGTQDFNQDGKTDVLWRYYGRGDDQGKTEVWLMDGAERIGTQSFLTITDRNWRPIPVRLPLLPEVTPPDSPTPQPPVSEPPVIPEPPVAEPPVTEPPEPNPPTTPELPEPEPPAAPATITVRQPNGGESLQAGEIYTIEWDSSLAETARVSLELYRGDERVEFLESFTPNRPVVK